jgi:GDP-4-dehydro-6-deoxy-D-mannose reductase
MKALITGITGFAGSHLADYLLGKGYEVWGLARWRSDTSNIAHIQDKLNIVEADMNDAHSLYSAVKQASPDEIYHLAAQSFVPTSWNVPADTMRTNAIGTINLFEAVMKAEISPRIQVACSSEEYGLVKSNETPIKETNPLRPLSPYGVSKIAQDMLAVQYNKSYGLRTVVTRAFNHTGPRRGKVFVCSDFARQIAMIEAGTAKIMNVGNLKAIRDFTDVRDMVRAYHLSLSGKCRYGERYNICSGKGRTIDNVLDMLLRLADKEIKVKEVKSKKRPSDVLVLIGDCSKFRKATGWKPKIPFEDTLEDLLEYWRVERR